MSEPPLHFALREMRNLMTSPAVLAVLAGAVVILAIAAPFGTGERMRFGPLLAYWGVVALGSFAFSAGFAAWATRQLAGRRGAIWLVPLAICAGLSIGLLALIAAINWLALGVAPLTADYLPGLAVNVFAVSAVVSVMIPFVLTRTRGVKIGSDNRRPAILDRLDHAKRGRLVSMSALDHYVEVATTAGTGLVLLRFGDALHEVAPVAGLRIHRSHWVALDEVRGARREGDRGVLTLTDGRELPVSRSYVPVVREAGLL